MAGSDKEYVVRGATLTCTKGCHKKKLELPEDHGVYTKDGLPMMHAKDYKVGVNIPENSFGICSGECPGEDMTMVDEDGETIIGPPCLPIIRQRWKEPHDTVYIDQNGVKYPALTTESFLVCTYGGIIEVEKSGQE